MDIQRPRVHWSVHMLICFKCVNKHTYVCNKSFDRKKKKGLK